MISTYMLKRRFQGLVRPCANQLLKAQVTPNMVTIFTILLSVVFSALLVAFSYSKTVFALAPVFLFVRMALNAIDGIMAKEGGLESNLGIFLNELGDVISDIALFFSFTSLNFIHFESVTLFALLAVLSEMAGIIAVQAGSSRRYEGPMGKSDRAVLIGVVAILIASGIQNRYVFNFVFGLGSTALILTIINRVKKGLPPSAQK